ncbi:MAG TPA: response regulator transcription factor [Candidatus Angelobacter sp.]|nr:response regulator transcription factor [Candidatus Angelobacter sp.]
MNGPARVLIADDQTLFRSGLARLLDAHPDVDVVGEAAGGAEVLALCATTEPDVVLMDLKMPGMDGLTATAQIVARHPNVKVLILTGFAADTYVIDALRAGASGYVLKDAQPQAIVYSILAVRDGERVMAGAVARRILGMISGEKPPADLYNGLTVRELEILKLVGSGAPNKQIAFKMHISEKTVRNHVSNVYEKLCISDRAQAILYAVRNGLVDN